MIKKILDWAGFTLFIFGAIFFILVAVAGGFYLAGSFLTWEWLPLPNDWLVLRLMAFFSAICAANPSYSYFQEEVLEYD